MSVSDILFIAVALSMDAFGVTLTNGMIYKKDSWAKRLLMPLFFACFQAIMPLTGYYVGSFFVEYIYRWSKYILFTVFFVIGLKMLIDGIKELRNPAEKEICKSLPVKTVVFQAFATSIDALAVGVGFSLEENMNIFISVMIIGLVTFILCLTALFIGRKFGDILGTKSPFAGAAILFFIAVKSLL